MDHLRGRPPAAWTTVPNRGVNTLTQRDIGLKECSVENILGLDILPRVTAITGIYKISSDELTLYLKGLEGNFRKPPVLLNANCFRLRIISNYD